MASLKERLALAWNKARQPRNASDCPTPDQEECDRLIAQMERSAWEMVAWGAIEIDRSFCWGHYDSACPDGSCPEGGSFSLHGLADFDPARLKGVARLLYDRLVSEEFGLHVEPIYYASGIVETFRFRVSWTH